MTSKINIDSWIKKANGFYQTSILLENPIIMIQTKIDATSSSWYLLHHSLELFLKSILINYDRFDSKTTKIHDLKKLVNMVKYLNKNIDNELNSKRSGRTIEQWIYFINPFGFPNGGLRYNQPENSCYAAPLGISYFFTNLVTIIKSECEMKKVISKDLLH